MISSGRANPATGMIVVEAAFFLSRRIVGRSEVYEASLREEGWGWRKIWMRLCFKRRGLVLYVGLKKLRNLLRPRRRRGAAIEALKTE